MLRFFVGIRCQNESDEFVGEIAYHDDIAADNPSYKLFLKEASGMMVGTMPVL